MSLLNNFAFYKGFRKPGCSCLTPDYAYQIFHTIHEPDLIILQPLSLYWGFSIKALIFWWVGVGEWGVEVKASTLDSKKEITKGC